MCIYMYIYICICVIYMHMHTNTYMNAYRDVQSFCLHMLDYKSRSSMVPTTLKKP